MSKIEQLIKEKCPNGVEYKKLKELVDYIQPTKYIVKDTRYDDKYDIPVLTAGQTFILGYTNEKIGIYKADKNNPVIIFDDFTTSNHWIDFQFKVKSSAMKILTPKTQDAFKYIYYCIQNIKYVPKEHSRQWIQTFSEFKIPLPPIEVQEEIVKILDKFGEFEKKLTKELEARRKQYEYYRNYILGKKYTIISLDELCLNISSGKCNIRNKNGKYIVYGSTGAIAKTDIYKYNKDKILVARVGANAGFVHIATGKYDVTDNTLIVNLKPNVNMKYIYYYLQNFNLNKLTKGGGQPLITAKQIKAININLPPLEEQKRIVKILDKFDKLINDISEGIPAELEARKKQYEYYRNKLLSFEELKTND